MNKVVEKLLSVQELDVSRLKLEARLEEGPARLAEDEAELARHRDRYQDAARTAKEATRVAERKNADVDAADAKIQDLYTKMNTARSNKEYEAFKTEIAGHKADREILEEEALQQWGVGEEREKEAAAEETRVRELEAALEEKRREWEREEKALNEKLAELLVEREKRMQGLPPSWLMVYERVLERCGAPALVPVVEQYCQGCNMNISIHDVTRAWKGESVVQCHSCTRILYAETL